MKKLIVLFFYITALNATAQQKVNKFFVVDADTRKKIPVVSVTIVKAKLNITTEKDGIFIIPGDLSIMRDTVILNSQGYDLSKTTLRAMSLHDTLFLKRSRVENTAIVVKTNDDTLLNNFNRKEIAYYVGIHKEDELFENLQVAQQFDVSRAGIILTKVTVNRLASFIGRPDITGNFERTQFRVRIYDINPLTGGPGKDLCNEAIEESSGDTQQLGVNLKKYKIVVPHKTFFVAVEWMRDFKNAGYTMVYDKKVSDLRQLPNYRPAIGISPITGNKLNIWALNFKHEWKRYQYYMPFGTDLAIKAVINY
jgi:hypothetical protein